MSTRVWDRVKQSWKLILGTRYLGFLLGVRGNNTRRTASLLKVRIGSLLLASFLVGGDGGNEKESGLLLSSGRRVGVE